MKKVKVVVGICLLIQATAFFLLFLIYWNKKKSLARTLAIFAAVGGSAGGYLLWKAKKEQKEARESLDIEDQPEDDFENPFDEDDIFCNFEDEDDSEAEPAN